MHRSREYRFISISLWLVLSSNTSAFFKRHKIKPVIKKKRCYCVFGWETWYMILWKTFLSDEMQITSFFHICMLKIYPNDLLLSPRSKYHLWFIIENGHLLLKSCATKEKYKESKVTVYVLQKFMFFYYQVQFYR